MQNSQAKLFTLDTATRQSSADTLEYNLNLNPCVFAGNTYTNYDLYSITNVDTTIMDLANTNCLQTSAMPTCSGAYYYDTVLMACTGKFRHITFNHMHMYKFKLILRLNRLPYWLRYMHYRKHVYIMFGHKYDN